MKMNNPLKEKQDELEKKYGARLLGLAEAFGEALVEADPDHLNFLFAAVSFMVSYASARVNGQNMEPLDYRNYLYN